MRNLLTFGGLAHDPQSILAAVYGLALVGGKRLCDFDRRRVLRRLARFDWALQRSQMPRAGVVRFTIRNLRLAMHKV
jgi:hypothetical protein